MAQATNDKVCIQRKIFFENFLFLCNLDHTKTTLDQRSIRVSNQIDEIFRRYGGRD